MAKKKKEKKEYQQNVVVKDLGRPCPKCGYAYDHKITNTYPNGKRRIVCSKCKMPWILWRPNE